MAKALQVSGAGMAHGEGALTEPPAVALSECVLHWHSSMVDLSGLNPAQRDAVRHASGPLLVLAGAGSGKTRVITYRVAWLVDELGVDPGSILGVTFTNKAAGEMLERIEKLVPHRGYRRPRIGTFHSVSLRILRRHADKLGFTKSFAIYDTADQQSVIRRIMRELQISEETFPIRTIAGRISRAKGELIGPVEFERDNRDYFGERAGAVYKLYAKRLREFDAMDFDDLIGKHVELLREHPVARDDVRAMARHLLIDEYQDTNHAQYALIRELAGDDGNITAVGDEDQSIYRFRGAEIRNILAFEKDFPGARVIKLEQNYRSTSAILDAAIGVVSNNVERKGKKLFTDRSGGEPVSIVTCGNEREEAEWVISTIREMRDPYALSDFAVLFRTNAQSRSFEEELRRYNIAYVVVGGMKFYERAEIKDVLSYVRLAVRPHDPNAIERVINVPSRGVGTTTMKAIQEHAQSSEVSLWSVIEGELEFLPERARRAVGEFREIVHDLQRAASRSLPEFLSRFFELTGYRRIYEKSRDPQDETRLQNIDEFVNAANEYAEKNPEASLGDYLDSITLMADVDSYDNEKGVTLMTLHAAKGLEFPVVFLAGLEEGILPHTQSMNEPGGVEEERRLCYVGMTRAREKLFCLHCHRRRIYGMLREQSPSPFLAEIPAEVTDVIRVGSGNYEKPPEPAAWLSERTGGSRAGGGRRDSGGAVSGFFGNAPVRFDPSVIQTASPSRNAEAKGPRRGAKVQHEQFGLGTVLRIEGSGDTAKLTVYFDRAGTKKFIAKYAKLQWL